MEAEYDVLIRFFRSLRVNEASTAQAHKSLAASEDFNHCTYVRGYIEQSVFICKTCKTHLGFCGGCCLHCHAGHEVVELGPKKNFRCDCGLGPTACVLNPEKYPNSNSYNHNFLGRFCLCDREDSEDTRESDMHMCVSCYDWFHTSCIRIYNDCHNLAPRKLHQENIPILPEDTTQYFFLCESCVQENLYVPAFYGKYIHLERPVDSTPHCHVEVQRYPYHMFVERRWVEERCRCQFCMKLEVTDFQYVPLKKKLARERIEDVKMEIDEEMDEEIEVSGTHEQQIHMARGLCVLRELISQAMQENLRANFHAEMQEFKRRILEHQTKSYM